MGDTAGDFPHGCRHKRKDYKITMMPRFGKKQKSNSQPDWTERNVGLASPNLPRCTVLLETDELFFVER